MITEKQKRNFWKKVVKTENCWEWHGCRDKCGYGVLGLGLKLFLAHRVSWQIHFNPLLWDGKTCVLHKCDNPSCVNPDHLFLGTQKDNADDRERKNRGNRANGEKHWARRMPDKIPRGVRSGNAKMDDKKIVEIRRLYASGMHQWKIGSLFGLHQSTVGAIVLRETWRHVP